MSRRLRHTSRLFPLLCLLLLTLCGGCAKKETPPPDEPVAAVDSTEKHSYTALGDSTTAEEADTLSARDRFADLIERFPGEHLIDTSFALHDTAFMEISGLDGVMTADYVIDGRTVQLYVTDDNSGTKYLALMDFAVSQSQVRPALIAFDGGYSVVFNHRKLGRVLGGLKSGYLVGVIGFDESLEPFLRRWVGSIK